ncbi:MAG: ATP-binding protein, partial [Thermoanaerobaculia bacterium]|nr:ATP-binding protein [Thermoanaerobaculia bacterium]
MPQAKIHLPQIQTVTLRGLSLFPDHPAISLNFSHDVLCFAGANGIGKSTLLAAISYGLTGIVAEPSRKFASVEEYYKDCAKFAQSYFSGRVAEQDRDRAQIDLQFALHDHQYELSRGLFEPETLRSLTIRSEEEVEYDGENASPESREEFYRVSVAGGVGVR